MSCQSRRRSVQHPMESGIGRQLQQQRGIAGRRSRPMLKWASVLRYAGAKSRDGLWVYHTIHMCLY